MVPKVTDENYDSLEDQPYYPWYYPEDYLNEAAEFLAEKCMSQVEFYTPDMPKLNRRETQFLFVYGSLKKGFDNHSLLQNSRFLCLALTKQPNWGLFNLDSFPVALEDHYQPTDPRSKRILGELYEVPTKLMPRLDYFEGNPRQYKRTKKIFKCLHPYNTAKGTQLVGAWMYIGNPNWFVPSRGGFTVAHSFTRNQAPKVSYYSFIKSGIKLRNDTK